MKSQVRSSCFSVPEPDLALKDNPPSPIIRYFEASLNLNSILEPVLKLPNFDISDFLSSSS